MSVFNEMIREVAYHYSKGDCILKTMSDYEIVCQTLLKKFRCLNDDITRIVNRINASSTRVKRLQTFVSLVV